jgi:hypothetical protein
MRAVKVILLGAFFSIIGLIGLLVLSIVIGMDRQPFVTGPFITPGSGHATGVSAILGGLALSEKISIGGRIHTKKNFERLR